MVNIENYRNKIILFFFLVKIAHINLILNIKQNMYVFARDNITRAHTQIFIHLLVSIICLATRSQARQIKLNHICTSNIRCVIICISFISL